MLGSTTGEWTIEADQPIGAVEAGQLGGPGGPAGGRGRGPSGPAPEAPRAGSDAGGPAAKPPPLAADRRDLTVRSLRLDEKAGLTGGADIWHTVGVERLGIPSLRLSDGPSGVRGVRFTGATSTCLPCGTALAATWDRDLVGRVGALLASEAQTKGAQVLLAPTVNLHRHPLGGRHFECLSEDPYLTAELAVAYIRAVQARGVACTAKHFVANDQEHDRMEVSVEVDERTLREIYLPPFEAAVRDGGVWAVMAAYNRLHGVHCTEHAGLLEGILRGEWGFDGVVMSDWYATHSTTAVAAGLDLEMPGPPRFLGHYLASAIRQGDLPESVLDLAVARLLELIERVSAPPATTGTEADAEPGIDAEPETEDAAEVAREVARQGIVLLRNEAVLPLDPSRHRTIAVIGPKADRPDIQGGGSAHVTPPYTVTPLEGIAARAEAASPGGPAVSLVHEPGVRWRPEAPLGRHELRLPGTDEPGLLVEHFTGPEAGGEPIHTEVVPETQLFWLGPPVPGVSPDQFSVLARADLLVDRSGLWELNVSSAGSSRVLVDGMVVLDNRDPVRGETFFGRGSIPLEGHVELRAGTRHRLEIELHSQIREGAEARWISGVTLTARPPEDPDAAARAVAAAQVADVVLVLVGSERPDSEGADRPHMDLPAEQNDLVRAIAAANPATVVVVNSGAPVTMDWVEQVGAVLQLWYLGQEVGSALADVLFGDCDAAGRLPTSFPRRLEDTPAFPTYPGSHGRAPYSEGVFVGYRHYDTHGIEPRFCFGHGLSYTQFAYSELTVEADALLADVVDRVAVSVDVTNVGLRPGREVVQLYVRDVVSSVERPARELKQFAKVELDPGETRTVRLDLSRRAFAYWDLHDHHWRVEPGAFEIAVGSSSRRIHATARLDLT